MKPNPSYYLAALILLMSFMFIARISAKPGSPRTPQFGFPIAMEGACIVEEETEIEQIHPDVCVFIVDPTWRLLSDLDKQFEVTREGFLSKNEAVTYITDCWWPEEDVWNPPKIYFLGSRLSWEMSVESFRTVSVGGSESAMSLIQGEVERNQLINQHELPHRLRPIE